MLQRCRHGIRLLAIWPSSSSSSSSYHTIQAVPREWTGSRVAARERTQGRIPSVVFRQGKIEDITNGKRPISKKHLLTTDRKQINSILKTVQQPFFCSTTFNLQIRAGPSSSLLLDSGTVLPIKVHTNPETGQILNLVFLWADGDSELNVDVPLVFKGEDVCPGLKKGMEDGGPPPFHFEIIWLVEKGCTDCFKNWWAAKPGREWMDFQLAQNLKLLKKKILDWRKEIFGSLTEKKNQLLTNIQSTDGREESGLLEVEERERRNSLYKQSHRLLVQEVLKWKQSSRSKCIEVGIGIQNTSRI